MNPLGAPTALEQHGGQGSCLLTEKACSEAKLPQGRQKLQEDVYLRPHTKAHQELLGWIADQQCEKASMVSCNVQEAEQ